MFMPLTRLRIPRYAHSQAHRTECNIAYTRKEVDVSELFRNAWMVAGVLYMAPFVAVVSYRGLSWFWVVARMTPFAIANIFPTGAMIAWAYGNLSRYDLLSYSIWSWIPSIAAFPLFCEGIRDVRTLSGMRRE